jgi:hypothetical protein
MSELGPKSEVAALRRNVCFAPVSGHRGRDCRADEAAPSAYLQFLFFEFLLLDQLFKGLAKNGVR